jgi:malic enzyme
LNRIRLFINTTFNISASNLASLTNTNLTTTSQLQMGKTLVVLGAGVAGLPIAHHVLRHTVPKVKDLKVILVTPNTDQ